MATILLLAFPISMILAAVEDLASMTISNRLVVGFAAIFPIFAVSIGLSPGEVALHMVAAFVVLAVTFGFFAAGWMGGGDAKLLAAAALWLGPTSTLVSFVAWTTIVGGVLTLAFLLVRTCLSPSTGRRSVDRLLNPRTGIPYGVAIGAAGLLVTPALFALIPS